VLQVVDQLHVVVVALLHLLALLVVVDGQLLQRLQHLLHLVLRRLVLRLQTVQLRLEVLVISAGRAEKLQTGERSGVLFLVFKCIWSAGIILCLLHYL